MAKSGCGNGRMLAAKEAAAVAANEAANEMGKAACSKIRCTQMRREDIR